MLTPHMLARLACVSSQQRCINLAIPLFRPDKLLCEEHIRRRARKCLATAAYMHVSSASETRHPQTLTPCPLDRPKSSRLEDTADYRSVVRFHTAHTSSPPNTSLTELLRHIPPTSVPAQEPERGRHSSWQSSIVVLVTPALASQAVANPTAFAELVSHSGNATKTPLMGDLIVAVVDRLPSPTPRHGRIANDPGSDGIAVLTTLQQESKPDVKLTKTKYNEAEGSDTKPSIRFVIKPKHDSQKRVGQQLSVHLANTIFHTGQPYTLKSYHWERSTDGSISFSRTGKHNQSIAEAISDCTISFEHNWLIQPSVNHARDLHMPLLPLTLPRRITAALGNIIRQLEGKITACGADSGAIDGDGPIPASRELEAAVERYFAIRNEPQRRVALWALVTRDANRAMRHGAALSESALVATTPPPAAYPCPDVAHGDFLCRVVSGGGGWGKKAGLLALDPDTIGSQVESQKQNDVLSGQYIQFYIAPDLEAETSVQTSSSPDQEVQQYTENAPTLCFGVIPSTVDDIPVASSTSDPASRPQIKVFENFFGALTESRLQIHQKSNDSRADRGTGPGFSNAIERDSSRGNTIDLDVPFTRWSATVSR